MLKLPKPSKLKRREMGKVKRADFVNNARRIGRADAIKKRYVYSDYMPFFLRYCHSRRRRVRNVQLRSDMM